MSRRTIKGFKLYECNETGKVFNKKTKKPVKESNGKYNLISNDGKRTSLTITKVIGLAWHYDTYKEGDEGLMNGVRHKDNFYWGTKKKRVQMVSPDYKHCKEYNSIKELCEDNGWRPARVRRAIKGGWLCDDWYIFMVD